jgi:hypothetical protein
VLSVRGKCSIVAKMTAICRCDASSVIRLSLGECRIPRKKQRPFTSHYKCFTGSYRSRTAFLELEVHNTFISQTLLPRRLRRLCLSGTLLSRLR